MAALIASQWYLVTVAAEFVVRTGGCSLRWPVVGQILTGVLTVREQLYSQHYP